MNTMEIPEPSTIEMRRNLAVDAQTGRYTREVLLAIMRAIDPVTHEHHAAS
jgi:hypothetical protein